MNIQDSWEKALKTTQIIRARAQSLETFSATTLPYVFLAQSAINSGDTVVRKGEIIVEKPAIVLPFNLPQFEGFDFEEGMKMDENLLKTFLLVRGVTFPSLKYNNKTDSLTVHEGKLQGAIELFHNRLQREEDAKTGLIVGAEDVWPFSVLLFICSQVFRSADKDLKRLFDDHYRRGLMS